MIFSTVFILTAMLDGVLREFRLKANIIAVEIGEDEYNLHSPQTVDLATDDVN